MSFSLIPRVDDKTFLFPEATMDALRRAMPGATDEQLQAAVQEYLAAHPPVAVDPRLDEHLASETPHDAYDVDMPSLTLIFENGLI
jgi:hypothetical protein